MKLEKFSKKNNGQRIGLLIAHVDDILFGELTKFENRVQRALEGLKLGTVKTLIIDFLGLSVETYSNHIEV